MMKRKLLLAALFVVGALGFNVHAQNDVTSQYLFNADFASGDAIDNHVCTYGKDMASNGTTYYGPQTIAGWTNASVGEMADDYENCKLAGALFAYGTEPWLAGAGTPAPATDSNGNAGKAAGLCAVWGGSIRYTQNVTLPKGCYTVLFEVYNATTNFGSGKLISDNYFGFEADGGAKYYAPSKTFAIGQWSTVAVTFNLDDETSGKISMGYKGPSGGADMPHLFVDNVKIISQTDYTDYTSKVGIQQGNWPGAAEMPGYAGTTADGREAQMAARYGFASEGVAISQTVSGLDDGVYEVAVFAMSQMEWKDNSWLTHDAGDVVYVFAESSNSKKTWINARRGPGFDKNGGPTIYTISGVNVRGGKMKIGLNIAKKDQTEWHMIQIKSLTRVSDIDLKDIIASYDKALSDAQELSATTEKVGSNVLAKLNTAISSYAKGKVDETDADALTAATDALTSAIAAVNKSITSYKLIATGKIPDDNLEGWQCENSNDFHINTWSTEGGPNLDGKTRPSYDGTDMIVPFIENWVKSGSYLGAGKVYYRLEGLDPGEVYYAQALVRSYNEANADAPNGPNFFINNVVTDLSKEGTIFTFSGMSGIYATLGGAATVGEDGTLTLGVVINDDCNYNWVAFKNVAIRPMADALAAAVANAATVVEGTIPQAAYDALQTTVNTNNKTYTTVEEYETAIGAINTATETAKAMITPYAAWKQLQTTAAEIVSAESNPKLNEKFTQFSAGVEASTTAAQVTQLVKTANALLTAYNDWMALKGAADILKDVLNDNADANSTLKTSINTQTANAVSALDETDPTQAVVKVNAATAALKEAMVTYVGAANPEGDGARFDLTWMLTNPDLTPWWGGEFGVGDYDVSKQYWGVQPDGWKSERSYGNFQVMTNASAVNGDKGIFMEYYMDYWNLTTDYDRFNIYINQNLPAGTYTLSCYAFATEAVYSSGNMSSAVFFYANDTQGSRITSNKLELAEISFINEEEQNVKIGLKSLEGNTCNWMGIGYVELYKVPGNTTTYVIAEGEITDGLNVDVMVDDAPATESLALKTVTLTVNKKDADLTVTVTDENDNPIDVANPEPGIYTFQMPACDVTYSVTAPIDNVKLAIKRSAGWGTFMSTFNFPIDNTDVKVYSVWLSNTSSQLILTEEEGDVIPAYTPVLVQLLKDGTDDYEQVIPGFRLKNSQKYEYGLLHGVVTPTVPPVGSYVMQQLDGKVNFYVVEDGFTQPVPAFRAYLEVPVSNSDIKAYFLPDGDEEASEIAGVEALTSGDYDAIYTPAGVKIDSLQKGLNIVVKGEKSYKIFVK